jgi:hypothetical protein
MKKSMTLSAAPSSNVNSPAEVSPGLSTSRAGAVELSRGVGCRVDCSVTITTLRGPGDWYQSVLIQVSAVPGNPLSVVASWIT